MSGNRIGLFALALAASLGLASSVFAQSLPSVTVTLELGSNVLGVGQMTTATVKALVNDPGPDNGIFTFDTNLIVSNNSVFQVVAGSVVRPDVDHSLDPLVGGDPDGELVNAGNEQRLEGVRGVYSDLGHGVGAAQILYTLQLIGIGEGSAKLNVNAGFDLAEPGHFGFDFTLWNEDGGISNAAVLDVFYPDGATVRVTPANGGSAVPEPHMAMLSLVGLAAAGLCAARRPVRAVAHA